VGRARCEVRRGGRGEAGMGVVAVLLRLDMEGAVRRERVFRVSEGKRPRPLGGVATTLDERELSPLDRESGLLSTVMGEAKGLGWTRSGVQGVEGLPWIWSQQSSQTRAGKMGDEGDAKEERGTLRGGWRKERLDASRRGVVRDVHVPQKMPPHLRQ